ncbi:hypothetical protein AB1K70_01225 [Bremerella sp. JC770]|uniref:hypothetical protein n=1 Tax=Bremerella sp. JC770 TaxID=3232137 RepID=UPI003457AD7E
MHLLFSPTLTLLLATVLAIGPGWCRMHCAASNDFGADRVVTCCHAKSADALPQPAHSGSADCRCQLQPVTNDAREIVVAPPTVLFVYEFSTPRSFASPPVPTTGVHVSDGRAQVPIHVLKCVWRC